MRTSAPRAPKAAFVTAGDDPLSFVPRFPGAIEPLAVLAANATGEGAVNWLPARDQVVRTVPLLVSAGGTQPERMPSRMSRICWSK